ncbi:MAG: hypothetical protein Q8P20_09535 [bacterium]|nr:hypothetical protein [bacterium]
METIRLADRDAFRQVEKEWQYEFISHVLFNIGIPQEILEGCLPEQFSDFTIDHKIELKKHLKKYSITIVDDRDHGLKFFLETQENDKKEFVLIAEWKKCRFNYKVDHIEVDPSKKMYVEIIADIWAIFDEFEKEKI